MNCLEFRRAVGAEPFSTAPGVAAHRATCAACARHQDELQAMDRLLSRALQVAWPPQAGAGSPRDGRPAHTAGTRRWLAMAASLAGGVLFAAALWVSYPRPTLAAEVMNHALHEPASWNMTRPLSPAAVADVLDSNGARLLPGAGEVTYARRCFFDGHFVPHLVVQTADGPVTVFLLAHRTVKRPVHLEDNGLSAVVLPAPRGSIAVVGRHVADLDAIARKVFANISWQS